MKRSANQRNEDADAPDRAADLGDQYEAAWALDDAPDWDVAVSDGLT